MPKKAVRVPVADRRYRQAVDLFEKAVKAFGRKDFDRARTHLDALIGGHEDQSDLVERARAYLAMCERAGGRRPARPRTFEELLNYDVDISIIRRGGPFDQGPYFPIPGES